MAENTWLGGINRYCLVLADYLNAQPDVEVLLLAPYRRDSQTWLIEGTHELGLRLELLAMNGAFDLSVVTRLGQILIRENVDVVHSQAFKSGVVSRLAIQRYGLPVRSVSTVHGLPALRGRVRWYFLLDILMKRYFEDSLIAVSKDTKARLVGRGLKAGRIFVIPNGVDVPHVTNKPEAIPEDLSLDPQLLTIGFVGRLDPEKGILSVVTIARRILKTRPDVQLLVAGDGVLRGLLLKFAQEFPGRVILAGMRQDVAMLYPLIDVLLFPAQEGEGLPFALLEAMSHEVPAVASRIAGTPELIDDGLNGFLLAPNDDMGMTHKTLALLQDASLRQVFGRNARSKVASAFTKKVMCERTLSVYRSLGSVSSPGPPLL